MDELFDLDPRIIYLNSANLSIMPKWVRQAQINYLLEFEKNPTQGLQSVWKKLWQTQEKLAHFLGASAQDLILRPNVTSVLNTFILGVPLAPAGTILAGELEYGSISNICRWRCEKEGRAFRVLKIPHRWLQLQKLSQQHLLESITSQISSDVRLLVLSHVIASTGLKLPVAEIAAYCRSKNVILVVDGAYAPGALPIDFSQWDEVDFYGASLYKFLLGPKGTAFGWVNKRHQETLSPSQIGWTTFDTFPPFDQFGDGSSFQQRFCLSGCLDFSPFLAVSELIDFWEQQGVSKIQGLLEKKQRLLEEKLTWRRLVPLEPSLRGRHTSFELPSCLQSQGARFQTFALKELGLQLHTVNLSEKWHGVLSPHIYSREEQIERAASLLNRLP